MLIKILFVRLVFFTLKLLDSGATLHDPTTALLYNDKNYTKTLQCCCGQAMDVENYSSS